MSKITVDVSGMAALSDFIRDEMQRKMQQAVEREALRFYVHGSGFWEKRRPYLRLVWVNPDAKLTNA